MTDHDNPDDANDSSADEPSSLEPSSGRAPCGRALRFVALCHGIGGRDHGCVRCRPGCATHSRDALGLVGSLMWIILWILVAILAVLAVLFLIAGIVLSTIALVKCAPGPARCRVFSDEPHHPCRLRGDAAHRPGHLRGVLRRILTKPRAEVSSRMRG